MLFEHLTVMGPSQITPRQAALAVLSHWLLNGPMTIDQLAGVLGVTRGDIVVARRDREAWTDLITETEEDLNGNPTRVLMPSRTFLREHILSQRATIEKLSKNKD